jgi:hypothetical protein
MATCARTSIKATGCDFRNNMMFQNAVVSDVTGRDLRKRGQRICDPLDSSLGRA